MRMTPSAFLNPFRVAGEPVNLRAFPPHGAKGEAIKIRTTLDDLATDQSLQQRLQNLNQRLGIYYVVNAGGDEDASINRYTAVFCESDDQSLADQHAALDAAPLQPSIRVETRKSVHAYWLLSGDCSENDWRGIQAGLIAWFDGDAKIKNPSRCMRLPGFNHVSIDDDGQLQYKPVECVLFEPERKYTASELVAAFPQPASGHADHDDDRDSNGHYETWEELTRELRRRILKHPSTKTRGEWAHTTGVCHNGKGNTALALNLSTLAYSCQNGCKQSDILKAFGLPTQPGNGSTLRLRNIFRADERKEHIKPALAVVDGVAYRQQVTLIEGLHGSGKTHVAVDIAATAAQFFKVLVITNEAPDEWDAQLDAWQAFHCRDLPGLHLLAEVAGLFDQSRVASIIETVEAIGGVDFIILDILSNEYEGREESNQNAAVLFSAASQIAHACFLAFIVTGHTGWSGERVRYGSQAYGSARRVFQVENSDELITVKVQKANVSRGMGARRFRILQIPWQQIPNGDPKRAEEYTALVPAESVLIDAGPLSARQLQILRCLALPVFASSGAYPREIVDHTKLAKSTVNNATSVLMTRQLAEDVRGKAGAIRVSNAGAAHLRALDAEENTSEKATEQGTNGGPLNWLVCSEVAPELTALVRDGSEAVRSGFGRSGSRFVRTPPSKEGTTTELPLEQPEGSGTDEAREGSVTL